MQRVDCYQVTVRFTCDEPDEDDDFKTVTTLKHETFLVVVPAAAAFEAAAASATQAVRLWRVEYEAEQKLDISDPQITSFELGDKTYSET